MKPIKSKDVTYTTLETWRKANIPEPTEEERKKLERFFYGVSGGTRYGVLVKK